jgi:hypothetical protein
MQSAGLPDGARTRKSRAVVVGVTRPRWVAMVQDVQAANRHPRSGIVLRAADYQNASALKRALTGIDDAVLISSDGHGVAYSHDGLFPFCFSPARRDKISLRFNLATSSVGLW